MYDTGEMYDSEHTDDTSGKKVILHEKNKSQI